MSEELKLISEGCLSTCWYGNYHYLEPFVGCSHACHYCYARYTSEVIRSLDERGNSFDNPVPFMSDSDLLSTIKKSVNTGKIKVLKLSRFTDIFSSPFLESGLSFQILKILVDSPVERIIITTKGVPDDLTIDLMTKFPSRFSYNVVAKPQSPVVLEQRIPLLKDRLSAASKINESGVLTTIHMDPIIPGLEDQEGTLIDFFKLLKTHNLNRVMFSYLLLNKPMIKRLEEKIGSSFVEELLSFYDTQGDLVQILPQQEETRHICLKPAEESKSIERISQLLDQNKFEFVLCGIKNAAHKADIPSHCTVCNGTFYA